MKNLYLILGLLFVSFAAVQYNDPDPYIWAPYYLLVAGACFLTYTNRYNKLLTLVLIGCLLYTSRSPCISIVDQSLISICGTHSILLDNLFVYTHSMKMVFWRRISFIFSPFHKSIWRIWTLSFEIMISN